MESIPKVGRKSGTKGGNKCATTCGEGDYRWCDRRGCFVPLDTCRRHAYVLLDKKCFYCMQVEFSF